jgi:anaerobic magnesium-protoporphyrin IX monomethyl ester cyclase
MKIHILQVRTRKSGRSNKDTNGGFGTVNDFGRSIPVWILKHIKNLSMNYPEIQPAYIRALLKQQGHIVTYSENILDPNADVFLIQTSIISIAEEIWWAAKIKKEFPGKKVGFYGGMCTANPDLFLEHADFIVKGEIENILPDISFNDIHGVIEAGFVKDLNNLPFPDWSHIHSWPRYTQWFQKRQGRSIPVLSSRGCPMSCRHYCTYPLVQGVKFRPRSPENVIAEIGYLVKTFNMSIAIFRDPIFTLNIERIEYFCDLLIQKHLNFSWMCETHPRFLNRNLIQKMARAGCNAIKIGVESGNDSVLNQSHRATTDFSYQEDVIRYCEENRIHILAFYILGYFTDTPETIRQTIDYAISLNTFGAQFTIATPYPGTPWYIELNNQNERSQLDPDFSRYNQYSLVFKHPHVSEKQINALKERAYQKYYYRWGYIKKNILGR